MTLSHELATIVGDRHVLVDADARGVAVVPQGGNTGLVGASVPRAGEVVLSLARLILFGHVSDGNVHVNVLGLAPDDDAADEAVLEWQAYLAYDVGMSGIQYTIRGVSPELDARLREEARETGRSLNSLVVERLEDATLPQQRVHHDLDWLFETAPPDAHEGEDEAQAWLDSLPNDLEIEIERERRERA